MDVRKISKLVQSYDPELRAECLMFPRIDIYRQRRDKTSPPYYVFSLTDNWQLTGKPVEWGAEPILARLKAMDLWNSGVGLEEAIAHNEQVDLSKERARKNSIESFLYEFRSQFHKTFSDVNTANMKKIDRRKEIENGYRKS